MLDKNSSKAMYEQIVEILREEILDKKYGDGGCIGTHEELARRFEVSLITIRKAVLLLEKADFVIIRQGKGTFVKAVTIGDQLSRLAGVSNMLSEKNLKPKVVVKSMKAIDTPDHFQDEIRNELGKKCFCITRAHMIDETVCGFAKIYLPLKYGQQLTADDIENNTIYQLYQSKFHINLGKGVQRIHADKATKPLAMGMNIPVSTPLLYITRSSYSAEKELIEHMELYYEYSQYYFQVELDLSTQ